VGRRACQQGMEYALTEYWLAEAENGSNSRNLFTHSSGELRTALVAQRTRATSKSNDTRWKTIAELSALRGVNGLAASIALKERF